ncbi:MAG TPA: class I SAM-dependent methyltransferase [Paraburkholderia sp.]|uniref:class I SAM-dependent methyltransferase n=1 Tax=Paraburkholderia sp. TaxID=1926495 RepID=UPI002B4A413C|nr:class I SAM-dependent methyltransferase [Paraburkholderia sp.]HKR39963.1 class I SAM-dependent methyltransferase [Paraburkholderia sp.]
MNTTGLAKAIMKLREVRPTSPQKDIGGCQELFHHQRFTGAAEAERRAIMLASSQKKYDEEMAYPWDHYFRVDLAPYLNGREVLDLGCFNGGRGVAWFERYKFKRLLGIDVAPEFIEAATQFAQSKGVNARFEMARGETLPLATQSIDAILSYDVFEHVQNLRQTLGECQRVLRPGGRLFVVFPSYYQPVEHHLALVTRMPGLQYLFSGATLTRAYYEILRERGNDAQWYWRATPELEPWEKGNTINGTTYRAFGKLIREGGWKVVMNSRAPLGSIGRNASRKLSYRLMSRLFAPLTALPGLQEIFLHRVTYILEKPGH